MQNRIEDCLFALASGNSRGRLPVNHQVIVRMIAASTTEIGPTVHGASEPSLAPAGLIVSERVMVGVHLIRHDFLRNESVPSCREPPHRVSNFGTRPKAAS
jgi:hypothetical protein